MIIPGDLVIKNGGRVITTGNIEWKNETDIEDRADVLVNGGTIHVIGDIIVTGMIRHDESSLVASCVPFKENE